MLLSGAIEGNLQKSPFFSIVTERRARGDEKMRTTVREPATRRDHWRTLRRRDGELRSRHNLLHTRRLDEHVPLCVENPYVVIPRIWDMGGAGSRFFHHLFVQEGLVVRMLLQDPPQDADLVGEELLVFFLEAAGQCP